MNLTEINLGELIGETVGSIVSRRHLDDSAIRFSSPIETIQVLGDRSELQTALA